MTSHSDLIDISNDISHKIHLLSEAKNKLREYATKKAESISAYEKNLCIVILKLRNNSLSEFEGQELKDLPASVLEKVARGICFQERLEMEKADAEYKSLITFIDATKAELNGLQSQFRYLEER